MDVLLWVLQALLAIMFLFHGLMLLGNRPPANPMMAYISAMPLTFRRFIGIAELAAALGLILPALTKILPVLTPLAATGLVIVMVSAAVFHFQRKENPNIIFNLVLAALALIVAYGRFVVVPL